MTFELDNEYEGLKKVIDDKNVQAGSKSRYYRDKIQYSCSPAVSYYAFLFY